ncbi:hypothetical protein GCM10027296_22960 [Chitinimonas naiadis]
MGDVVTNEIENLIKDELSEEHYHLSISSRKERDGFWIVRGTVSRRDSDEEVGGKQVSGVSEELALSALVGPLREYIESLPVPPYEWGRTELRKLLVDYRKFNNELTFILANLQKSLAAGVLSEQDLHAAYWAAREYATKGSVMIGHRLAVLPENDQIDLMTSSEAVYLDPTNPWNLDDLDGRSALFEFFAAPSKAVVVAHETHLRRLEESAG